MFVEDMYCPYPMMAEILCRKLLHPLLIVRFTL